MSLPAQEGHSSLTDVLCGVLCLWLALSSSSEVLSVPPQELQAAHHTDPCKPCRVYSFLMKVIFLMKMVGIRIMSSASVDSIQVRLRTFDVPLVFYRIYSLCLKKKTPQIGFKDYEHIDMILY